MTRLLCILALFLAFGCCKTETAVQPEVYSIPAPPDSEYIRS